MSKKKISRTTFKELIEKRENLCERCGRKEMLTVDHIVPISLLQRMGLTVEECYQEELLSLLCRPCNQLKSNNLDFSDKRTKVILLKYLENL